MLRTSHPFFQSNSSTQEDKSWLQKMHGLLTTHSEYWVRANQAMNLLSAAAATYIIVARPNAVSALTFVELMTHLTHGIAITIHDPSLHDKLVILNAFDILYSTIHHLTHQQGSIPFATAIAEVLFSHLVSNIWMNVVQANKYDQENRRFTSNQPR